MTKILININRLGFALTGKDIDTILDLINKSTNQEGGEFNIDKHTTDALVTWLGCPREQITREVLERYVKMSPQELYIPFTLAEPEKVEQRIIAPLTSAKKLACLGEFLASIALSGLVGEMLAIFIWELNRTERKGPDGSTVKDRNLIGEGFSQLPQNQRVNLLQSFGYINSTQVGKFKELASRRNNILHSWTDAHTREQIEEHAIACFSCAALLMKQIFGIELADAGSLKVNQKVLNYLGNK